MTFTYDTTPTKFLYRFNLDHAVIQDFIVRLENSSFSEEEFDEYASDEWDYECDESAFYDWIRFDSDEIFRGMEERYGKKERS